MRAGFRRAIGVGGAAFVALGAALVLALPASAHTHNIDASCNADTGVIHLTFSLTNYAKDTKGEGVNTVVVTDTLPDGTVLTLVPQQNFGTSFGPVTFDNKSKPAVPTDVVNKFELKVTAWDDLNKDGQSQGFSFDITKTVKPCKETPPSSSSSSPPPPSHSSTQPPAPTTTTKAPVVAAASNQLPNTGVNAGMPLMIAGVLVVAGGGILLWLRIAAKRRGTNNS